MSALPESIRFLSMDDLLAIHRIAIEDQHGDPGIRDRGALESALAQPKQQFGSRVAARDGRGVCLPHLAESPVS